MHKNKHSYSDASLLRNVFSTFNSLISSLPEPLFLSDTKPYFIAEMTFQILT